MATVNCFYSLFTNDQSLVDSQAGKLLSLTPRQAATAFSAPIVGIDTPSTVSAPLPAPPYILLVNGAASDSLLGVSAGSFSSGTGFFLDGAVHSHALANYPGDTALWVGQILLNPFAALTNIPLSNIRAFEGWELGTSMESNGQSGGSAQFITNSVVYPTSYDASRVVGDRGFPIRTTGSGGNTYTYNAPLNTFNSQWQQFYVRPRATGTGVLTIFKSSQTNGGTQILALGLTAGNQLQAVFNPGAGQTILGTSSLSLPQGLWSRIDILENYNFAPSGTTGGALQWIVYVNQRQVLQVNGTAGAAGSFHLTSTMGIGTPISPAPGAGFAADVDDWTIRAYPNVTNPAWLTASDWVNGTHVLPLRGRTLATDSSPNWTGAPSSLGAIFPDTVVGGMSCSTSTSRLAVTTDFRYTYGLQKLGVEAIQSCLLNRSGSSAAGSLGARYTVSGQTLPVTTELAHSVPAPATTAFSSEIGVQFTGFGIFLPTVLTTCDLIFDPGNITGTLNITGFQGTALCLGAFGPEDSVGLKIAKVDPHQAAYPLLPWAYALNQAPPAAVLVETNSYAGNGTSVTVPFNAPPTFLYIRGTNAGGVPQSAVLWSSAMQAGHLISQRTADATAFMGVIPNLPPGSNNVLVPDAATGYVIGANAASNASGGSYVTVSISDLAGLYNRNSDSSFDTALAGPVTPILGDNNFVGAAAQYCGFLLHDSTSANSTSANYFRGTGHINQNASLFDAAESTGISGLTQGTFSLLNPVYADVSTTYSLFRNTNSVTSQVVDVVTYTGNGAGGTRNITVNLGGNTPVLAIVCPHNGSTYVRDPGHTGTNSTPAVGGAAITTGITGLSANTVTVGPTLNANTIVYDVFVIGAAGWYPGDTPPPPSPADPNGWWQSNSGFQSMASLIVSSDRPAGPRSWTKLPNWAVSAAGNDYFGGFPAMTSTFTHHLFYPADLYVQGTDQPPIRGFDGIADRELIRIPPTSTGGVPLAVMSMLAQGNVIYISTLDSGTSGANFSGRVFTFDPLSLALTPLGAAFSGGEIPYAMAFHAGRLWVGTNKSNAAPGKVYWIRPLQDTVFTVDRDLTGDSVGGVASMYSFNGKLYVGTDNAAASFAKILARNSDTTWATVLTASGGTARANNGFPYITSFTPPSGTPQLVASYWNNDTTPVATLYTSPDGVTWTTAFSGTGASARPYILLFQALNNLYIVGGAKDLSIYLAQTPDLVTFTNLTGFLLQPIPEAAVPAIGIV